MAPIIRQKDVIGNLSTLLKVFSQVPISITLNVDVSTNTRDV